MSEQVKVSPVFVDWVTAVAPVANNNSWLRRFLSKEECREVYKSFHRQFGVEYYPSGIRHYYSPHEAEQSSVLVFDGGALSNIRRNNDNDFASKVVAILARSSSHFSRCDISVDIFDEGAFAKQLYDDLSRDEDQMKTMFGRRKVTLIKSNGETVYAGARTSPQFLRVYNKAKQSEGKTLTSRIEFELKAEAAMAVTDVLSLYRGWTSLPRLFTGFLNSFADWDNYLVINDLTHGDVQVLDIQPRERLMERKQWLRRQVLPTLGAKGDPEGKELGRWMIEQIERVLSSA